MDDLIYTNGRHRDVGVISAYDLSLEFGPNARNDFLLTCPLRNRPSIEPKSIVYIEGTEFGGIVDKIGVDTKQSAHRAIYRGRTWHGILAGKVICPDAGQSHYRISGEANAALLTLIHRMGLTDLFTASARSSGITLSHPVRNEYAYSGILAALRASGAKLKVAWDGSRVELSAEPIRDWSATGELDTDRLGLELEKSYRPVNHLVCLGIGELEKRITVHFFADAQGKVSETQTLFGVDENTRIYDYSNAEVDELRTKGREKLEEYQNADTCDADVTDGYEYDVGDIVGAFDPETGLFVSAPVVLKAVTVDKHGSRVSYEVGETVSNSGLVETGESSGGGRTYVAGANVTITGNTISAAVGLQDLAGVENTARDAYTTASSASAAAGRAQDTADAAVSEIAATSPIAASRGAAKVTLAHAKSGVVAGAYGPTTNLAPAFGDTVTLPPRLSLDATGHVTGAEGRSLKIPSAAATKTAAGLMSAAAFTKLDSIDAGANKYTHPANAGNKHIPSGGAAGQILRWSADGTATWGADSNTTYGIATTEAAGLVKPDGVTVKITSDGTLSAEQGGTASFLAAYPPGSLFWSESPTAPTGGSWERRTWPYGYLWARKD